MGGTSGQLSVARGSCAGAKSYRRRRVLFAAPLPLLLAGLLLTGCSGGSPEAGSSSASPTSAKDRGLEFAKCMRENGVKNFPDPADNGGQIVGKDSGVDPESAEFKKAQEACKDVMPQIDNKSAGGQPADLAKAREWAQCVRDHGVPQFPDPEIQGNVAVVDVTNVPDGEGAPLDNALEVCQSKRPSGNLSMQRSGGGK